MKANLGIKVERYLEVSRNGKCIEADYKSLGDLVVNAGLNWLCSFFDVSANNPLNMRFISIGTSGSAAVAGQTALGSQAMSGSAAYVKGGDGIANLWSEFDITDTYALYECAIQVSQVVDSGATNSMYARDTYAVKNVVSGDTVRVSYSIQFTAA